MAAVLDMKTPADRNKLIAAIVLGVLALGALYFAFGRSIFGSSTTTVKVTTSPTPVAAKTPTGPAATRVDTPMPSQTEQDIVYQTQQIAYRPGQIGAPDAGRNIFA